MTTLSALDRLEIIELQSIYAWAIDGNAPEEFAQVFTADVDANYAEFVQLRGLPSVTRWLEAFHAPLDASQHIIANHHLSVGPTSVIMRSYVNVRLVRKGHPGGDLLSSGGRYLDQVVRTDAGWRISAREVRNMWRTGNHGIIDLGRDAVANL
jgi:hypothetical protein